MLIKKYNIKVGPCVPLTPRWTVCTFSRTPKSRDWSLDGLLLLLARLLPLLLGLSMVDDVLTPLTLSPVEWVTNDDEVVIKLEKAGLR